MDYRLVRRLTGDKLRDRHTYVVAAIVGTLIAVYGQLLVPWFRGSSNPFAVLFDELEARPALTLFSIFLGYAFPLSVGVYSSVATRYHNRRVESVADFPDRKPDPVFRAARNGEMVEVGAATRTMFDAHRIDSAQAILGDKVWAEISARTEPGSGAIVYFEPEDASYIVSHAPTANDQINIYLTRLP